MSLGRPCRPPQHLAIQRLGSPRRSPPRSGCGSTSRTCLHPYSCTRWTGSRVRGSRPASAADEPRLRPRYARPVGVGRVVVEGCVDERSARPRRRIAGVELHPRRDLLDRAVVCERDGQDVEVAGAREVPHEIHVQRVRAREVPHRRLDHRRRLRASCRESGGGRSQSGDHDRERDGNRAAHIFLPVWVF
jgi:hypothetical protein